MHKPRLVIVGDSTALPRDELSYEDTYEFLLKLSMDDWDIFNYSVRGNTLGKILELKQYYFKYINPNIVILHVGIVDAYPRPYPQNAVFSFLKNQFSKFLFDIDKFLIRTELYYKMSDFFNFKKTEVNNFSQSIEYLLSYINAEKVIIVGIIKAHHQLRKCKIVDSQFDLYNAILKSKISNNIAYIDLSEISEDFVLSDGYHLNEKGHKYLFNVIKTLLSDNKY